MRTTTPVRVEIDRREQLPWTFAGEDVEVIGATLPTGDYRLAEHPGCVIERKSPSDLLGCMTAGRDRFERELARLDELDHAAVVVEGDLGELLSGAHSQIHPSSVVGSLVAWSQRFPGVHWWMMPSRRWAERMALRILLRYRQDVMEGKRPSPTAGAK